MMIQVVLLWSLGILSWYLVSLTMKNQWQQVRIMRPPLLNIRTSHLRLYVENMTVPEVTSSLGQNINSNAMIYEIRGRTRHLQQTQELSIGKYRVDMNEEYLDIQLKYWISGGAVLLCLATLILCYYCKCCFCCCRFGCCSKNRKRRESPKQSDASDTVSEATRSDSGKNTAPNQEAMLECSHIDEDDGSYDKREPWWTNADGKSSIHCVY